MPSEGLWRAGAHGRPSGRGENPSASRGVSRPGNVDLARWPVIVATVDGFLFVTRTCLAARRTGLNERVCGCAAAPLVGGLRHVWGYRAPCAKTDRNGTASSPARLRIVSRRAGQ